MSRCHGCFPYLAFVRLTVAHEAINAYGFTVETPGETVAVRINETTAGERVLYAAFEGVRAPFSDMALLRLLVTYPAMTLKVVVAIHWEALRLWLKGLRIFRHERASTPIAHSIVETKQGTRHG